MKEIVEKLCRIEAELNRRRAEDKLAAYNTGERKHEKQLAFHRCKKRNRWVFGGNRSGKTECGAAECVYMALGIIPTAKTKGTYAAGSCPSPRRCRGTWRRKRFYITCGGI